MLVWTALWAEENRHGSTLAVQPAGCQFIKKSLHRATASSRFVCYLGFTFRLTYTFLCWWANLSRLTLAWARAQVYFWLYTTCLICVMMSWKHTPPTYCEVWSAVHFLTLKNNYGAEIHCCLCAAYEEQHVMNLRNVQQWQSMLWEGRTNTQTMMRAKEKFVYGGFIDKLKKNIEKIVWECQSTS